MRADRAAHAGHVRPRQRPDAAVPRGPGRRCGLQRRAAVTAGALAAVVRRAVRVPLAAPGADAGALVAVAAGEARRARRRRAVGKADIGVEHHAGGVERPVGVRCLGSSPRGRSCTPPCCRRRRIGKLSSCVNAGDGERAGVQARRRHVRPAADVAARVTVGADQQRRVRPVVGGIGDVTARDAGLDPGGPVVRGQLRRRGGVRRSVHVRGVSTRVRARPMAIGAAARDVGGVVDVSRVLRGAALVRRGVAALAEGLGPRRMTIRAGVGDSGVEPELPLVVIGVVTAVGARAVDRGVPGGRIVERRSQTRAEVHRAVGANTRVRGHRYAVVAMTVGAARDQGGSGIGVQVVVGQALVGVGVGPGNAGQVREPIAAVAAVTGGTGSPAALGIVVGVANFAVDPRREIAAAVLRVGRTGAHQRAERARAGRWGFAHPAGAVALRVVAAAFAVRAVEIERPGGGGHVVLQETRCGVEDRLGGRGGDGGRREIARCLRLLGNHEDVGGRARHPPSARRGSPDSRAARLRRSCGPCTRPGSGTRCRCPISDCPSPSRGPNC